MINKLMVSGCSFTEDKNWPKFLFSPGKYEVTNLGKAGGGNEYIANSIMYNIDTKPDFVYILWSGVNRSDMRVPNSKIFEKFTHNYREVQLGNSKFFLSGHGVDPDKGWLAGYNDIKLPHWPEIKSIADWLDLPEDIKTECLDHKINLSTDGGAVRSWCHQYFMTQHLDIDKEYRSEKTFQNMLMCFNLLDNLKIPYRFSFIYDIWSNDNFALGQAVKEKYYHLIDWKKFIDLPPFEYGVKHNLLESDEFHVTEDGMIQWAGEINKILKKQQELKNFF